MTSRYPVTFLLFSLLAGTVCIRLGVWQLDRLHARRAANALALASRSLPVEDIRNLKESGADRRARVSGTYDFSQEIVLRGRGRDGVPGVQVVTPLIITGTDTAVLILRGYVPSADASSYNADIHREPDTATVVGLTSRVPLDSAGAQPLVRNGARTWRRLDLTTLREILPYPVLPLYLIADSPATASPAPSRIRTPALDDGPHLNYAIQWFGFATIAFGGAAALWWSRRRNQFPPG